MGARPSTFVKYAKFLDDLKDWCKQDDLINLYDLTNTYKVSGRIPAFLLTMRIVETSITSKSGYCFKDPRNTMQIARELGHAVFKATKLGRESTEEKKLGNIKSEQSPEELTIVTAPITMHIEPGSVSYSLTEIERQLLRMVLATTQEPDLMPFANKMLDRI
jgi:hypothetical protein